jgi:ribosome-associated heat shock protein Hsp15
MRLDKWLWAARFCKTRAIACEAIDSGRVKVNELAAKPAREVKPGDRLTLRLDTQSREFIIRALSLQRGPASVAQGLYEETQQSVTERERWLEQRRLAPEPALSIEHGRPTKRDRRDLQRNRDWGDRWTASIED